MDPSPPFDYTKALRDANIDSDHADRTVSIGDIDLQLRYAPEPGVEMRAQGLEAGEPVAGAESVLYEAASERPASYPPELPYVPGLKVSRVLSADGGTVAVMWWSVPDVESVLRDILAQCEAAGWAQVADPDASQIPGMRMIHLRRDGVRRMINMVSVGDGAMISLLEDVGE